MSIYLWIDPGTTTLGFAVIKKEARNVEILNFGVITTPPKVEMHMKLYDIWRDMQELLDTYKPDFCGMEKLFFLKNVKTGIDVAQARWAIAYILSSRGIPLLEYTPLQVKKWICGNGSADKKQVQNALKMILKLTSIPKPDDAADALAIAYITSLKG